MKRIGTIILSLVLVLGLTQCKKTEQPTADNTENTIAITLSVGGNNGNAKVDVDPSTGTVDFEGGDIIYVGSGGKYVGMLTHNGNHHFQGNISDPVEGEPLQFYFLGNVTPEETLGAGTTEECSVIISDQTQRLPVISCAPSNEDFSLTNTTYTAHLLNKCSLVKFNVTTISTAPVCVTGMYNKVTVDFVNNTVAYSQDGDGILMLPAGAGQDVEKWAIVLPQPALEEGEEGSVYSLGGNYIGTRPAMPEVLVNAYWQAGIALTTNVEVFPMGSIKGLFSINSYGGQVFFSQGNLQYIGSAATPYWQFAEHQWDYFGNNGQGTNNLTVDRDLFGWGTSGYNHGALSYQPWATATSTSSYYAYGNSSCNLYDQTGQADWGYNAVLNGGDTENYGWRTLTKDEWVYVFNTRTGAASKKGHGNVNGVNGMILLPDEWTLPAGLTFTSGNSNWVNVYSSDQWTQMEANGAVFLPAAGNRDGISLSNVGSYGYYWSSSYQDNNNAFSVYFYSGSLDPQGTNYRFRNRGRSVRLVRDAQ